MSDPRLAHFRIDVGPTLRFVHPYRYSQGQTFAYHHVPNGIAFTPPFDLAGFAPDWPTNDYPATLPTEHADLVTSEPDPDEFNVDKIFISETQPTLQDESGRGCEACGAKPLTLVAVIPSSPLPNLELWGKYGGGVTANFWYCRACHAMNTANSTD
jgi:hypothetical protein